MLCNDEKCIFSKHDLEYVFIRDFQIKLSQIKGFNFHPVLGKQVEWTSYVQYFGTINISMQKR